MKREAIYLNYNFTISLKYQYLEFYGLDQEMTLSSALAIRLRYKLSSFPYVKDNKVIIDLNNKEYNLIKINGMFKHTIDNISF